ncbi:helix-turn-helix domain-containing protein (plasmid) [Hafnia alvei]|uniref:helix-turn-helix domain-containing protein n=1 Tax=Hafnia alvei TaxID=569 RepID=UPI000B6DAE99|nr:helix-turn-helix domain-containing protein [Hafnia alvei]MBI0278582.1 helix-turn-helix domain-containing protein [Hafnia alvei]PNL03878.1 cytoplasmic protein [Hafnia alvei]
MSDESFDLSCTLHSFEFSQKTKPFEAIMALHKALTPHSEHFHLPKNNYYQLSLNKSDARIVLITEGCFSLYHAEKDLCLATGFSPTVVGLTDAYSLYYNVEPRPRHYIYGETECFGFKIEIDNFVKLADELNLWHDVAKLLAQRLITRSARDKELVGVDAYTQIKFLLKELWLYPDNIRNSINVQQYIQQRSHLSRSGILKIIAELRKGKYIKIQAGKLLSINSKFPAQF